MVTLRYACGTCRTVYRTHAEAERCERLGHRSRTIWPTPRPSHQKDQHNGR